MTLSGWCSPVGTTHHPTAHRLCRVPACQCPDDPAAHGIDADWMTRQNRARDTYRAEQNPKPDNPRACVDCGAPTKTKSGLCAACQETR